MAAGEELGSLDELRAVARRHPALSVAASAGLGVLLAPLGALLARR